MCKLGGSAREAKQDRGTALKYLVSRGVSVSPWGGRAAGRGRGDLTVGALLP